MSSMLNVWIDSNLMNDKKKLKEIHIKLCNLKLIGFTFRKEYTC